MMMGTQQQLTFGAPQTNIPGNPSKVILNEDEMMIEGVRFIEKKSLKNEGIKSYITHSRTIGAALYEVVATIQNGVFVQFDVNTNLESKEQIDIIEQLWSNLWRDDKSCLPRGSVGNRSSSGSES